MKETASLPNLKEDPFFEREQGKYTHPIASREYLLQKFRASGVPISLSELAHILHLEGSERLLALRRRIRAMVRDGQLVHCQRGRYCLVENLELIQGEVIGHREGFGFLSVRGEPQDYFLSVTQMQHCLPGDLVLAQKLPEGKGRKEAAILRVLVPRDPKLIGRCWLDDSGKRRIQPYTASMPNRFLLEEDPSSTPFEEGAIVLGELKSRPEGQKLGSVLSLKHLGKPETPEKAIAIVLQEHQIPCAWPKGIEEELARLPAVVHKKDKVGRKDLTDLPFVTIDGEDAKDFDDAVYGKREGQGWRLWVAIADVSHYVQPATLLDLEARNRGTSLYFPKTVIPMLPEVLSNHLCSLVPHEERLAFVCELTLSEKAKVTSSQFYPAVIRSRDRLTYRGVEEALELLRHSEKSNPPLFQKHPMLKELYALTEKLLEDRSKRGALDLEVDTIETVFDAQGKPTALKLQPRGEAHRLIEELMILANVAAAEQASQARISSLYRVHAKPESSKIESLKLFLEAFSLIPPGTSVGRGGKAYQKLLKSAHKQKELWPFLQLTFLKTLKPAAYTTKNEGHFGLALTHYAHFTSPIRRYPDLILHRLLKSAQERLNAKKEDKVKKTPPYRRQEVEEIGQHCTLRERRADLASREVGDWLKAEIAARHLGETHFGRIISVSPAGAHVQLEGLLLEGLLSVQSLSAQGYRCLFRSQVLKNGETLLRLGSRLKVRIEKADPWERRILLELDTPSNHAAAPTGLRKNKRKLKCSKARKKTKKTKK